MERHWNPRRDVDGSDYRHTSGFGPRKAPTPGASTYHRGEDWAAQAGTPVPAYDNGKVHYVGQTSGYGNNVVIEHSDKEGKIIGYSNHAHLAKDHMVKQGQTVLKGETIGKVGGPQNHAAGR